MTTTLFTRALTLGLIAPAAALPLVMPSRAQGPSAAEASALHARFDPSLGSLRAGRVDAPAPFGALERFELGAAQQAQGDSLALLRGGAAPTDSEWGWIAVGAAVVLLIVLL